MDSQKHTSSLSFIAHFDAEKISVSAVSQLKKLAAIIQQRKKKKQPCDKLITKFEKIKLTSTAIVTQKRKSIPNITFPDILPISNKKNDIAELIQNNQVVILAGETGSGKTTQIPKILLTLGYGCRGLIGHTQPRRIAARTVASRIAEELNVELGSSVGYQVRFVDHSNDNTHIKLMTDGILLAEIQHDPLLLKYDALIIDEAHERSLNIDFLLGYLKNILPKRPDLKIIITSATIDIEQFSQHFSFHSSLSSSLQPAPIIQVSGRTYPVEVLYAPWHDEYDELKDAIIHAVKRCVDLAQAKAGDILIFLSGERDIRQVSLALKKAQIKNIRILPLYARLSLAEQNKVFSSGGRGRKVVLATNVAETSITVPGIRFVIDPGVARIKRYSLRTKVERLPIEPISQASANQRKGRCGRVSDGTCIRLYAQDDFEQRPEFTEAEILRSNLAAVLLQMLQLRIGDIEDFPFVDPPDKRSINDGYKLLEELGAVDQRNHITAMGRQLQALPLDPSIARMLLAAGKNHCVKELLIIASGLTIQDPRERPAEKKQAADEKHRRFYDENSDFLALVNLWNYVEEQRQALTQNQLRKLCQKEYLNYLRLREWRELHHQLSTSVRSLKEDKVSFKINQQAASYESIHRSILSGFLTSVGQRVEIEKNHPTAKAMKAKTAEKKPKTLNEYKGTRNKTFAIFPGSSQYKKRPKWLCAASMLETSQLFAHGVAKVEPQWILDLAQHITKETYFEPHYNVNTGQVMAFAKVSLLGLILTEKKRVNYSQIDAKLSREVFVRSALVENLIEKKYLRVKKPEKNGSENLLKNNTISHFYFHNKNIIEKLKDQESKTRRRDILVDDNRIFELYDALIPQDITNFAGFEYWRKKIEIKTPQYLFFSEAQLTLNQNASNEQQFPNSIDCEGIIFSTNYQFDPGRQDDGVSIKIPVNMLHSVPENYLQWLVPGMLREKCIHLMKALPKQIRKKFVPVPEYADKALSLMKVSNQPLASALANALSHLMGEKSLEKIARESFETAHIDNYYYMNILVVDTQQKVIDRGRDLSVLRERYKDQVQATIKKASHSLERKHIKNWDFDKLPIVVDLSQGNVTIQGFPALIDDKNSVSIQILDNQQEAELLSNQGILRLAMLQCDSIVKYLKKDLLKGKDLGLAAVNIGHRDKVADSIIRAAISNACFIQHFDDQQGLYQSMLMQPKLIRDKAMFVKSLTLGQGNIIEVANVYEKLLLAILKDCVEIKKSIKTHKNALAMAFTFADIKEQMDHLIFEDFLFDVPLVWLKNYPRYLKAIKARIEKAPQSPQKDKVMISTLKPLWQKHQDRLAKKNDYKNDAQWQQYRWMLEEFRVSLFAQTLKTLMPISEKRLKKQWTLVDSD